MHVGSQHRQILTQVQTNSRSKIKHSHRNKSKTVTAHSESIVVSSDRKKDRHDLISARKSVRQNRYTYHLGILARHSNHTQHKSRSKNIFAVHSIACELDYRPRRVDYFHLWHLEEQPIILIENSLLEACTQLNKINMIISASIDLY